MPYLLSSGKLSRQVPRPWSFPACSCPQFALESTAPEAGFLGALGWYPQVLPCLPPLLPPPFAFSPPSFKVLELALKEVLPGSTVRMPPCLDLLSLLPQPAVLSA